MAENVPPISLRSYGSALGLAALGTSWDNAHRILNAWQGPGEALVAIALILWLCQVVSLPG